MSKVKFKFSTEFQLDLLRFTVLDRDGHKVLMLIRDYYFTLIEHQFIFYAILGYHKKYRRVPGKSLLIEAVKELFNHRDYIDKLTRDDEQSILSIITTLYQGSVRDGETILAKAEEFAQFVELKDVVEEVDLENFSQYATFSRKVQKAIAPRIKERIKRGAFLVRNIRDRQFNRQDNPSIVPTPFRQINALTNAGGYAKASIIVILDKPKKSKTLALICVALGYLRMKKKVLFIDMENGEDELFLRAEQNLANKTKREILSGEYDTKVQKILRKYHRLGAELVIRRLPAFTTTAATIQTLIDDYYREEGIRFNALIIDYIGKMGSVTGKEDDTQRISDAYVEVADLAMLNDIDHVWTAHHVQRPAEKREKTRYVGNDIAKCIDIIRHAQAIFGLNRNPEEEESGFMRFEIVEQRDGKSTGRAVFNINQDTQRMVELSVTQRKEYDKLFQEIDRVEATDKSDYKPDM